MKIIKTNILKIILSSSCIIFVLISFFNLIKGNSIVGSFTRYSESNSPICTIYFFANNKANLCYEPFEYSSSIDSEMSFSGSWQLKPLSEKENDKSVTNYYVDLLYFDSASGNHGAQMIFLYKDGNLLSKSNHDICYIRNKK